MENLLYLIGATTVIVWALCKTPLYKFIEERL